MKLSEVLAENSVSLNVGDYLASITEGAGYVPTHKDTDSFHTGQYLYKIEGVGEADADTGEYAGIKVVPVRTSDDGKGFEAVSDKPIIVQGEGKVTYVHGRNHPDYKDGYNGVKSVVVEGIASGEEHRNVLLAFLEYVKSEFSLGVNDFIVADPEMIEG